jgi:hypothetical protein
MLKILSIEDCNGVFIGYVEDGEMYRSFEVTPTEIHFTGNFQKSEYGEFERFAAIIGKFDPYAMFFIEPKVISALNYEELQSIVKRLAQSQNGGDHESREKQAHQEEIEEAKRHQGGDAPGSPSGRL